MFQLKVHIIENTISFFCFVLHHLRFYFMEYDGLLEKYVRIRRRAAVKDNVRRTVFFGNLSFRKARMMQ
jgi:hypothetical protein